MARLEDIVVDSYVSGIEGDDAVTVAAVKWVGSNAINVIYQDSRGNIGTKMIYREMAESIEIQEKHLPWSFAADGDTMRLVSGSTYIFR